MGNLRSSAELMPLAVPADLLKSFCSKNFLPAFFGQPVPGRLFSISKAAGLQDAPVHAVNFLESAADAPAVMGTYPAQVIAAPDKAN